MRKNHSHAGRSPITSACGTIAMMVGMHLMSINFSAELPRYLQDRRVLTDSRRRVGSGFENSETSARALSSLS
jgi:hypothetical protein